MHAWAGRRLCTTNPTVGRKHGISNQKFPEILQNQPKSRRFRPKIFNIRLIYSSIDRSTLFRVITHPELRDIQRPISFTSKSLIFEPKCERSALKISVLGLFFVGGYWSVCIANNAGNPPILSYCLIQKNSTRNVSNETIYWKFEFEILYNGYNSRQIDGYYSFTW
jgi:hypothetical protein